MSYESPIEIFKAPIESVMKKRNEQEEKYILQCIEKIGVKVNEEELVKALQYDRHQYEKGYKDGYDDGVAEQQAEIARLEGILDKRCDVCPAVTNAIKESIKKFEKKIKDVNFTLGQTWEIQCALKQVLEEMTLQS